MLNIFYIGSKTWVILGCDFDFGDYWVSSFCFIPRSTCFSELWRERVWSKSSELSVLNQVTFCKTITFILCFSFYLFFLVQTGNMFVVSSSWLWEVNERNLSSSLLSPFLLSGKCWQHFLRLVRMYSVPLFSSEQMNGQLKSCFYLLSHLLLVIALAVQTKPVYC